MNTHTATQIVILGGSGDLSRRKLLPALFELTVRGKLTPQNFRIIGLARSPRSKSDYDEFVKDAIHKHVDISFTDDDVQTFCSHLDYIAGSFNEKSTYDQIKQHLESFDAEQGSRTNRLFYLAVPPNLYEQIFTDLKVNELANDTEGAWTHILVEKPFGNNLETAQQLDKKLASLYNEKQIFRIDHYLAKEAVQNILSFRFANTLLSAPWDNRSIESVHIKMHETIDVGSRAGFYEGIGALRDVGQNHLLQLLALIAMKEPVEFTSEAIRDERVRVLEALKPISKEDIEQKALRAQYEGYKADESIPDDSHTETYFELISELDLPEWEDVPFYIEAGKALDTAEVSITINFKDVASGLFETQSCLSVGNQVILRISPEQTISIRLNAKSPGLGYQLETRTLSFTCQKGNEEIKNSYEKVLYDSIIGDQTLFTRTEEVLAAWRYITPILEHWHSIPLHTYEKGSSGPERRIIK